MNKNQAAHPNSLAPYWMPFTANRAFKKRPRMIVGAEGMHYLTADGRRVIDATSGLYCVNAGHGHPRIVAAIRKAAGTLDYAPAFQFGHPDAFALSSRLAIMAPGNLDHVFYASSGSEAIDTALKIALSYHRRRGEGQRTRFIGRERGYHGVGFGGISVGGMGPNRKVFGSMLGGVDHLPTTYVRDEQAFSIGQPEWGEHLADELERILNLHDPSNIAGIVVEPVAGSTGCLPPPKGYLEKLREITHRHDLLLIFDEVITAFGRLGHAFASDKWGIVPDMIAFAKGVTNGAVPLSGVMVSAAIYETHMEGPEHLPELFHGFTYSGHPLATAAALAAIQVYEDEGLFQRARENEPLLAETLMTLKEAPGVLDIRPIGMMCGIDLAPSKEGVGVRGFEIMERAFHDHDLYIRVGGDTLIVAPPLIATPCHIAQIRDKLAELIHRTAAS
ncbi:MAG: aspartate aminotransferase family protein [Hyphomicrobiaceae bacterium]|nr:aspartate aminotransferase family protein [Hyphomicrobiaceae bacterium]MCC0011494.1 aspartate aminotransferase family protein [Hyphomicrobiaceae bacterium]